MFVIILIAGSLLAATSQGSQSSTRLISVNACGTKRVERDIFSVDVTSTFIASTTSKANGEASTATSSLISALKLVGVPVANITSSYSSVSPHMVFVPSDVSSQNGGAYTQQGWESSRTIHVEGQATLSDAVVNAATDLSFSFNSLTFLSSAGARDAAMCAALSVAAHESRRKAEALAAGLGLAAALGPPLRIIESGSTPYPPPQPRYFSAMSADAPTAPSFSPGEESVAACITADFELMP